MSGFWDYLLGIEDVTAAASRVRAIELAIEASTYTTDGTMGALLELAHLIHEWIENGTWQ